VGGPKEPGAERRQIPEATVARLPLYLRALVGLADSGDTTVSSEALADAAGVTSAKVRKDLSYLGSYGTRGVGYDVWHLIHEVREELGLTQHWQIVIAGIGNLGQALAHYRGFTERGFRVAALVDVDTAKHGLRIEDLEVRPLDELGDLVRERAIAMGVIATPASAAQDVADRMVDAGLRSILNFAPAMVVVPNGVKVRKVDLAVELQILAYYEQRGAEAEDRARDGVSAGS
jgi:redox-sensing transcriptional repressor